MASLRGESCLYIEDNEKGHHHLRQQYSAHTQEKSWLRLWLISSSFAFADFI